MYLSLNEESNSGMEIEMISLVGFAGPCHMLATGRGLGTASVTLYGSWRGWFMVSCLCPGGSALKLSNTCSAFELFSPPPAFSQKSSHFPEKRDFPFFLCFF